MSKFEIGCYADGTYGAHATLGVVYRLVYGLGYVDGHADRIQAVLGDLASVINADCPDGDGSAVQAAVDVLDRHAGRPDAAWGFRDGDFGLWEHED